MKKFVKSELVIHETIEEKESVLAAAQESKEPDFNKMTEEERVAWLLAHKK